MTTLAYTAIVTSLIRHIVLLGALWLMASPAAFAGQNDAPAADEFCSPVRRAEIRCPKTSANICVCFMRGKVSQSETQLQQVIQLATTVKLPRPNRRCRVLPEATEQPTLKTFVAGVPTPPPRF
jgi:hypothetical protein